MKPRIFISILIIVFLILFVVTTVVTIFLNLGNFEEISVGFPYVYYETGAGSGGDFFSELNYLNLTFDILIYLGMSTTIATIFAILFR